MGTENDKLSDFKRIHVILLQKYVFFGEQYFTNFAIPVQNGITNDMHLTPSKDLGLEKRLFVRSLQTTDQYPLVTNEGEMGQVVTKRGESK